MDMITSSRAASEAAAARHARLLDTGAPRDHRAVIVGIALCGSGALLLALVAPLAAAALGLPAAVLVRVLVEDRRNAWRFQPEPSTPAVLRPPKPAAVEPDVIDLRDPAPAPPVAARHRPTTPVPVGMVPQPRVAARSAQKAPVTRG